MSSTVAVPEDRILYVKSSTDVAKLSGAIAACYSKDNDTPIVLRACGAGAVNQAVKGAAASNAHFIGTGRMVCLVPSFTKITVEEKGKPEQRVAIEFVVKLLRP